MIIFNERSYKEKEKKKQTNDVELRIGSSRNRSKPTTERHCAIPKSERAARQEDRFLPK
jgi:hypothetical protein